jgi:beta-lactamase regulating signal transducer with metallopeptidase domain
MSHNVLLWLTSYVVNAVWQVAALACAGWGLSRLVKPVGPELQHKVWVAILMLATFMPATPVIQYYFGRQSSIGEVSASSATFVARLAARPNPLRGPALIVQPIVLYVISGLYLAALLLCFLRLCWMLRRTAALVSHAHAASTAPDYAELWHTSKKTLSVPSAALLCSREVSGPVTAGLRRPVLLLPATFLEDCSRGEFMAAVAHECAHMKRDDFRKNVFYEIVGLFTAFHPLTWFIKSQIAQTREMVCDQMAAEQLPDRRSYALSLLQLAGRMRTATSAGAYTMGMFDAGILERRIMTLTTSMPGLSGTRRGLCTATAIVLLSLCAGGIGLMTRTVAAQTVSPSAQTPPSASTASIMQQRLRLLFEQAATPDLSCTYYDKGVGHDGTCGYDKNDKKKYLCYLNSDPAKSQTQIGCEWKLRRAEESKK